MYIRTLNYRAKSSLGGDGFLDGLARLVFEECAVDVGEDATLCNSCHAHHLVELLVVADSKLQMARGDDLLVVLLGSVASELEDFVGQVLEDGSGEYASTNADSVRVAALLEFARHTADGEDEVGARGFCLGLGASLACHISKLFFSCFSYNY